MKFLSFFFLVLICVANCFHRQSDQEDETLEQKNDFFSFSEPEQIDLKLGGWMDFGEEDSDLPLEKSDYFDGILNSFDDSKLYLQNGDEDLVNKNIFGDEEEKVDSENLQNREYDDGFALLNSMINMKPKIQEKEPEPVNNVASDLFDPKFTPEDYESNQFLNDEILSLNLVKEQNDKIQEKIEDENDWLLYRPENDYDYFLNNLNKEMNDFDDEENKKHNIELILLTNSANKITVRILNIDDKNKVEDTDGIKWPGWQVPSEGKYLDDYVYTDNKDLEDKLLAHRYVQRSSMFLVSTIIVIFSVAIFSFCLLCKVFKARKAHREQQKNQDYQLLSEVA